jgi:aryl-alcohol dehydrogenase-like predicted oxidoreductase
MTFVFTIRRKRWGRTNLDVSELSLGTVELGLDYGIDNERRPSECEASELLHYALDRGINLIDTARAYGDAERVIGRALKGQREEYVLVSKVLPMPEAPMKVRSQVEESLIQLQTDHVDVMMVHCRANQTLPDDDTVDVLKTVRREGKVLYLGASVYGPEAAIAAINCGCFDCIEVGYSVLDRRIDMEALPLAVEKDVGVIARSVLLKGALSERYLLLPPALEPMKQSIAQLASIAGGVSRLPELAYRYVCNRPAPQTALIGTARREEIDECIRYLERGPLSPQEIEAIQQVRITEEQWLNPGNWPS